jgi:hypothetical protein
VISLEQLSLLFLHLSRWVEACSGEIEIEFIIEEIKEEGEKAKEIFLYDNPIEYNCTTFETLQFAIAQLTQLLHTYPTANYIELSTPNIPDASITTDDQYTQVDKDLAETDSEDEEDEESEIDNSVCGFECNEEHENCNKPEYCQGCPKLNKCSCCTKYPCEKLLKEAKEAEARTEAALQEDLDL